jgi:hypothetical protein
LITTIHLLRAGKPLCGFSDAFPRDWPEGNTWQSCDKIDGGLAGHHGVLTKEIEHPDKWRACRGCVRSTVKLLVASGWKFKKGHDVDTLFERLGLSMDAEGTKT